MVAEAQDNEGAMTPLPAHSPLKVPFSLAIASEHEWQINKWTTEIPERQMAFELRSEVGNGFLSCPEKHLHMTFKAVRAKRESVFVC